MARGPNVTTALLAMLWIAPAPATAQVFDADMTVAEWILNDVPYRGYWYAGGVATFGVLDPDVFTHDGMDIRVELIRVPPSGGHLRLTLVRIDGGGPIPAESLPLVLHMDSYTWDLHRQPPTLLGRPAHPLAHRYEFETAPVLTVGDMMNVRLTEPSSIPALPFTGLIVLAAMLAGAGLRRWRATP